jgi:hypothetical protein
MEVSETAGMEIEQMLNNDDLVGDNPLEAYLNPSGMGSYSETDLVAAFSGIQSKLRNLGVAPAGDIFRTDIENAKLTVRCLNDMINRLMLQQDNKGISTQKVSKLELEIKNLKTQLEKSNAKKRVLEGENTSLNARVKKLENELADRKKVFQTKEKEFENEKAIWDNKYKQWSNENKKKDNIIAKLSSMNTSQGKETTVVNSLEVIGEVTRPGPRFYGSADAYAEFMSFCNDATREEFMTLKRENDAMREQLTELNQMMTEIVRVRKSIIEAKVQDTEESGSSSILTSIRQELLSLKEGDMEQVSLTILRENMKRFREFIDKVDSTVLGFPVDKAYQFNSDADIDEIKAVKRLKDLLKNYKYVVHSQDQLLQRALTKTAGDSTKQEARRVSLLDDSGLERAKTFLEEQRRFLSSSRAVFEKAKKTIADSERKVEEEKKVMLSKRQGFEQEARMLQEKIAGPNPASQKGY